MRSEIHNPSFDLEDKIKSKIENFKKKAIEQGNLVLNQSPQFIGNFFSSDKHINFFKKGNFEIYFDLIDLENIKCTSIDFYGEANIIGVLTEEQIYFKKIYNPSNSSIECCQQQIYFQGELNKNDVYEGIWIEDNNPQNTGEFYMRINIELPQHR